MQHGVHTFLYSKCIILYRINLSKNKSFKYVKAYYRLFLFFKKRLKRIYEDYIFYRNLRPEKAPEYYVLEKAYTRIESPPNKLKQMKG